MSKTRTVPASFAQGRLWFLDQYEPGTCLYNLGRAFRLLGPLNLPALQNALEEIIRRHDTLRTTFSAPSGEPLQIISPPFSLELAVTDLCRLPAADRQAAATAWLKKELESPFDLARGPLFRPALLRLDDGEHWLSLATHHIISDEWSHQILNRELSALYPAFRSGAPSPLPDLPLQYRDYDAWQREWLAGGALADQLAYWRGQLEGAPAMLEIATDHPRPAVQTHTGAARTASYSTELLSGLRSFSRSRGATPFMAALAAWAVLLHRLSGQDEVVIGTPIANRQRVEWESLIGFFVNTLPLRVNLAGNPSFVELLSRVRDMALDAYEHQDLPFERLVEELRPERSLSYSPLFQVMFSLQTVPLARLDLPGLEVSQIPAENPAARWDLSLNLAGTTEGLNARLLYNADLFDSATMDGRLGNLNALLQSIVEDPDQPIGRLELLSAAERRRVLSEWNPPPRRFPQALAHERFSALAHDNPSARALSSSRLTLTYGELNWRANQLARHLARHGAGPEKLVGISMEPCPEQVIALLGVLKAGAAFVPLDPQLPDARLSWLLLDTGAVALLTQTALEPRLLSLTERLTFPPYVLSLDAAETALAVESREDPPLGPGPQNLAYMIYTSGSTGRPKGAMIEHRNLSNYLSWVNTDLAPGGEPAMPFTTRLSFDACLKQVLGPLQCGKDVWIVEPEAATDAPRLLAELGSRPRVAFGGVPTLWKSLLDAMEQDPAGRPGPGLSHVFLGGEALDAATVKRTWCLLPSLTVWNIYGPTETTPNATAGPLADDGLVPIGRPIGNARLYILDRYGSPVPPGQPGELFIGGAGVGRGYWQRPDLTAERFVPDPFATEPGQRLYRTGDRCRHLADGRIEFLGRLDDQIKLRGYRIELGEIEHILSSHPSVREALVLLVDEPPLEKRLVGYVMPAATPPPTRQELLRFLHVRLPAYMIPAQFVFVSNLPHLPSGKVDRRALPRPADVAAEEELADVAPRTPVEELVTGIWKELLGRESIGVNESFFDLGGHSLLATRVVARLRHSLGVSVPLRTLFEFPTVAGLAGKVEELLAGQK